MKTESKTCKSDNTWYVLGIEDENSPYGYSQITPKGLFHTTLQDAKNVRDVVQKDKSFSKGKKIYIFERSCKVLKI
jgi:hypothetical protein